MFVELPHSDTDGVNFASGVGLFNPDTCGNRYQNIQHYLQLPKFLHIFSVTASKLGLNK